VDYLGYDVGIKMKSTIGWAEYERGTNESGFTALGNGIVSATDGNIASAWVLTTFTVWANTLAPGTSYPILYAIGNDMPNFTKYVSNNILGASEPKRHGCAVRCVKD
jgi:uncharacterized protein (TIGR02145 family)